MATKDKLILDLNNKEANPIAIPAVTNQSGNPGAVAPAADSTPMMAPGSAYAHDDKDGGAVSPNHQSEGMSKKGNKANATGTAKVVYPDMPEYETYANNPYAESETVQQAAAALQAIQAAQPGAYQSQWQGQINDIINRILNREKFTYDVNEDALYQQYADQFTRLGKLAMQDTTGQMAAMTGGYGNSFAATVGNQAYQNYLAQLNDKIPELYKLSFDKYNMEGQEMYNQYGLLSDQEAQDYGRYQDAYNQWLAERDYATGRYDSERDYDYGKYVDDRNFGYQVHTDEQNRAWEEYVTKVQQAQWGASFAEGIREFDENMAFNEKTHADTVTQWGIENGFTQQQIDETIKQNVIGNQQWNTSRQDGLNSEAKAYAREDVMAVISAGGTPTDAQLKAAGMSKETAAAMKAISSGDEEEALKYVGSMPSDEITEVLESYATEGNSRAVETFLDDLYYSGRITFEAYKEWDLKYNPTKKGHGITDTTVATPARPTMGGGSVLNRVHN